MAARDAERSPGRMRALGGAPHPGRRSGRETDVKARVELPETSARGQALLIRESIDTGSQSIRLRLGASIHRPGMCVEVETAWRTRSISNSKSGPRAALAVTSSWQPLS